MTPKNINKDIAGWCFDIVVKGIKHISPHSPVIENGSLKNKRISKTRVKPAFVVNNIIPPTEELNLGGSYSVDHFILHDQFIHLCRNCGCDEHRAYENNGPDRNAV